MTSCQIHRPRSRHSMSMLCAHRSRYVHLSIASLKIFSMESHHRIPLHEAVPAPQLCQAALFSAACSTATPPMSMTRHRPLLPPGLEIFLKRHRQNGEQIELQGRSPAVVEVPYAKGKRRNASAGERRKRPLPWQNSASSSRPQKPSATQQSATAPQTQPSLQPQPAVPNSFNTPALGDHAAATSSTPSRPDVMLRQAGLWTRFWLFILCLSPEYQDGRH